MATESLGVVAAGCPGLERQLVLGVAHEKGDESLLIVRQRRR
jgi:hypothetical protein